MSREDGNLSWKLNVNDKGEFVRKASSFRNFVTADGSSGFQAEAGRYNLYVSLACPWASRTLIARKLKGLEDVISVDVVHWHLTEKGWHFDPEFPGCTPDTVNHKDYLREIYFQADPDYEGRFTVPVLWDKQTGTIVNNESSEILRMLNAEFNAFCSTDAQRQLDLYPEPLRAEIDALNDWIYPQVNNGVYRAGFARSQDAYDAAVKDVFNGLDKLEGILKQKRFLTGPQLTEADIRLFVTLIRFDPVYVGHFKCNKKRIVDYPALWGYLRDVLSTPGVRDTVNQEHIQKCYQCNKKRIVDYPALWGYLRDVLSTPGVRDTVNHEHFEKHYQVSHTTINPHGIVAIGPALDYEAPHGREHLGQ